DKQRIDTRFFNAGCGDRFFDRRCRQLYRCALRVLAYRCQTDADHEYFFHGDALLCACGLVRTLYCKYWPPLIDSVEPVMKPASSAARNTTPRAISSMPP